jgi:hypothetical protein
MFLQHQSHDGRGSDVYVFAASKNCVDEAAHEPTVQAIFGSQSCDPCKSDSLGNLGQTDGESCQKVLKKGGDRVIRQPASDRNSLLYKLLGIASKVVPYDLDKRFLPLGKTEPRYHDYF